MEPSSKDGQVIKEELTPSGNQNLAQRRKKGHMFMGSSES